MSQCALVTELYLAPTDIVMAYIIKTYLYSYGLSQYALVTALYLAPTYDWLQWLHTDSTTGCSTGCNDHCTPTAHRLHTFGLHDLCALAAVVAAALGADGRRRLRCGGREDEAALARTLAITI